MLYDRVVNTLLEEIDDIIERIDYAAHDKDITHEQRVDTIAARDYIYNGLLKLKNCRRNEK